MHHDAGQVTPAMRLISHNEDKRKKEEKKKKSAPTSKTCKTARAGRSECKAIFTLFLFPLLNRPQLLMIVSSGRT
jgi:hypothetical protein